MKRTLLLLLFSTILGTLSNAQSTLHYQHDAAGNRTGRIVRNVGPRPNSLVIDSVLSQVPFTPMASAPMVGDSVAIPGDPLTTHSGLLAEVAAQDSIAALFPQMANILLSGYAVGAIPLQEGISQTGGKTYSLTVPTAPGIDYAPTIGIQYNSQSGNDEAGYGWRITGVSSINITNKNHHFNKEVIAANAETGVGGYALDGDPLLLNTNEQLSASYNRMTFRGKVAINSVIRNSSVIGFNAAYPNGEKARFGTASDTPKLAKYPILESEDVNGNKILYEYYEDTNSHGRECYIKTIKYGIRANGTACGRIEFTYENRLDWHDLFYAGRKFQKKRLLKAIESYSSDSLLVRYNFTHELNGGVNLLKRIDCTSSTGEKVPPIDISYITNDLPQTSDSLFCQKEIFLSSFFEEPRYMNRAGTGTQPTKEFVFTRGKFTSGSFDDGIVIFPKTPSSPSSNREIAVLRYKRDALSEDRFTPVADSLFADEGFLGVMAVDIDGDGADELVKLNSSVLGNNTQVTITVLNFSESGKTYTTQTHSVLIGERINGSNARPVYPRWGDFDGKGRTSLLLLTARDCLLSNGNTKSFSDSHIRLINLETGDVEILQSEEIYEDEINRIFCEDVNSDGRYELCRFNEYGSQMSVLRRSFSYFTADMTYQFGYNLCQNEGPYLADANGDGYLDFIVPPQAGSTSPTWVFVCFTGNDYVSYSHNIATIPEDNKVCCYDINHDGLSDMLVYGNGLITYYINNNFDSFTSGSYYPFARHNSFDLVACSLGDVTGISCPAVIRNGHLCLLGYSGDAGGRRLISRVRDSYGNTSTLGFKKMSSTDVYQVDTTKIYNASDYIVKFALPIYLLSSEYSVSGSLRTKDVHYTYFDAAYGTIGLGFLGFGKTRVLDGIRNTTLTNTFIPQNYGALQSSVAKLTYYSDGLISTQSYSYDDHVDRGVKASRLVSVSGTNHLKNIHTETGYEYDDWDYPLVTTTTNWVGNNSFGALAEIKENIYDHRAEGGFYMLGAPAMVSTRKGKGATINNDSWEERAVFWRDSLMRVVRKKVFVGTCSEFEEFEDPEAEPEHIGGVSINWFNPPIPDPDDPGEPEDPVDTTSVINTRINPDNLVNLLGRAGNLLSETRWTYSAKGKVLSEKSASYGASDFIGDEYTYDNDGRFVLTKKDALGNITSYQGYNKWGHPTRALDPRGNLTLYSYNSWGEPIVVQNPDGGQKTVSRQWDSSVSGGLFKTTVHETGAPDEVTISDAMGRDIRSGIRSFNGTMRFVDRQYRQNGQILKESLPFRSADSILWKTYNYDAYGRLTDEYYPGGGRTIVSYNGTSVKTVKDSVETIKTTDAWGRLISSEDAGGSISYHLLDHGGPSKITAPGGVQTLFSYDNYGRRAGVTDPSAGLITDSWTHQSSGASTHTATNALGTITSHEDQYGRPTSILRSDGNKSTFSYNEYGQLVLSATLDSQDDTLHIQSIQYDALGRLSKSIETQYEGAAEAYKLTTELTYGTGSVLRSKKYSVGNSVLATEHYSYSNGHLVSIKLSDSTVVWTLNAENALGQVTGAYCGSILKEATYSNTGLPITRRMAPGAIQNTAYSFASTTSNMMSRTDVGRSLSETFTYDALNRLKTIGQQNIKFDNSGNIKRFEGIASMSYPDDDNPYRLAHATPATSGIIPSQTQNLTFTSFGRPRTMSQGAWKADFDYGESDERTIMHLRDVDSVIVMTRFYAQSGAYERDVTAGGSTTERLYLGGDAYDAPMALVKTSSGTSLYVIGRDVIGSITHICTPNGTLVAEYSYDAWGRQRNQQDIQLYTPGQEPDLLLGRGWTGHEWLPWFGLYNANARLYDPYIARFLSPDPYVQSPDFTQNFNRYLYGYGNPLKYVDKDGKFFWIPIIIGAVVGMYTSGVVANNGQYNPFKWDFSSGKTWAYMFSGGLFGAIGGYFGGWVSSALAPYASAGGFAGGAIIGAGSSATSGFVNGFGMTLVNGGSFWDAINEGGRSAFWGGLGGAVFGGLWEGTHSLIKGDNFFYGTRYNVTPTYSFREKGIIGEQMANDMILKEGGEIYASQATFNIDGTNVRVDFVAGFNGDKVLIEVKNGPFADFTHNQSIAYPKIYGGKLPYLERSSISSFLSTDYLSKPMVPITPVGPVAKGVWPYNPVVYDYKFIIIHF